MLEWYFFVAVDAPVVLRPELEVQLGTQKSIWLLVRARRRGDPMMVTTWTELSLTCKENLH